LKPDYTDTSVEDMAENDIPAIPVFVLVPSCFPTKQNCEDMLQKVLKNS